MDAAEVAWLRSPEGRAAADEAVAALAGGEELGVLRRLSRTYGSDRARAAVALVTGRRAAARKFADADELFCDREAAEQASGDVPARHTAARFARYGRVADLGCGMGGDAMALARHATVLAVDRDPARLAMLTANVAARGLSGRVEVAEADIERWERPEDVEALWLDPARRDQGGRRVDPESWSPPLSTALRLAGDLPAGIKLAPGIDVDAVPRNSELEFVSHGRRLVEAVLWLGALASVPRRATVLPEGETLAGDPDRGATAIGEPGYFLFDPDPSVGRASLIDALAPTLHAWKLEERVAYLTGNDPVNSPFVRRFRVLAWMPQSERRLYEQLGAMGAGRVEVMRRASPVDTNALERRLNDALRGGDTVLTVALTRQGERRIAIICEREWD